MGNGGCRSNRAERIGIAFLVFWFYGPMVGGRFIVAMLLISTLRHRLAVQPRPTAGLGSSG